MDIKETAMPDIITKFGQHINKEIVKNPDMARKELLLGYRTFNLKMRYAPDKRLSPENIWARCAWTSI